MSAGARAEAVARASYGRLVAIIASRTRDIMAAEDALAEAFAEALKHWPTRGIPDQPEAWLITTARRKLIDAQRRAARIELPGELPDLPDLTEQNTLPDERLKLLFVCAHPAIDPNIHTPLMLQTVLGLEATDIARAFLLPPSAMAQRLVRAKRKIKAAAIPFATPEAEDLPPRMAAVREAIYGAFATDWLAGESPLGAEALYLAQTLADLAPNDAEALGLAALLGFIQARRAARIVEGQFVPLQKQDTTLWNKDEFTKAETLLNRAAPLRQLGRFQLEAAIQAVHAARATTGETDWRALAQLYTGLCKLYPTIGAAVSHAAASAEDVGAEAGLALLAKIDAKALQTYQPAWALRAHLLARIGQHAEAHSAYAKAISLTTDPPLRTWLATQQARLKLKPN